MRRELGGERRDALRGGDGNDTIAGDEGNDRISVVGRGADRISCGPGTDIVFA